MFGPCATVSPRNLECTVYMEERGEIVKITGLISKLSETGDLELLCPLIRTCSALGGAERPGELQTGCSRSNRLRPPERAPTTSHIGLCPRWAGHHERLIGTLCWVLYWGNAKERPRQRNAPSSRKKSTSKGVVRAESRVQFRYVRSGT